MANPQPQATAPIPNVITVSTPLYQQAGERENPLQILEGNKFVSPSQQFLPQVNDLLNIYSATNVRSFEDFPVTLL